MANTFWHPWRNILPVSGGGPSGGESQHAPLRNAQARNKTETHKLRTHEQTHTHKHILPGTVILCNDVRRYSIGNLLRVVFEKLLGRAQFE